MPQTHHQHLIHATDPAYAPAVVRAPSPTDSFGTVYDEDATSLSDSELNDEEFARKCEERIGLITGETEEYALGPTQGVLLMRPRNSAEEKLLFDKIMLTLREKVTDLEQEEFFETALARQSLLSEEPDPDDIDAIMQSMLGPSQGRTNHNDNGQGNVSMISRMNERMNHDREDSGATAIPLSSMAAKKGFR